MAPNDQDKPAKDDPLRPSEVPEGIPGVLGAHAVPDDGTGGKLDTSRWNRALVDARLKALTAEVEVVRAGGDAAVSTHLAERIAQLSSDPRVEAQVTCFAAILSQLAWHEKQGGIAPADIARLAEMGEAILKTNGITAGASKLSFLHADLQQSLALIRRKEGRSFEAAWQTQIAMSLGRRDTDATAGHGALASALRSLRRGDARLALAGLELAEGQGLTPDLKEKARLARLQALRLAGDGDEAVRLATETITQVTLSEQGLREFEWEELCRGVAQHGDLSPLVAAVSRGRSHRNTTYLLEASLWVKCVSSKQWLTRVPKAESIRRLTPETLKKPAHNAGFYECCLTLDRCYDQAIPLPMRVKALGQTLAQASRLLTIDKEMLLWAAAARWLVRHHQYMFAALALGEYKSLCLRLSGGTSSDTLALVSDLRDTAWLRFDDHGRMGQYDGKAAIKKLPTSAAHRAVGVTRLTAQVATSKLKSRFKRLGASPEEVASILTAEQEEIAAQLLRTIGSLKGPMVKTAQLVNYVSPDLPPSIREALSQMQDATPPFDTGMLKDVFREELGKTVDEAFNFFSDTPLAAASIGQIHRAALSDGRSVVVKIQYPGIEAAIKSDMKWARLLNFVYRRNFPSADIEALTDESEVTLLAECDYEREAAYQTKIRANFAGDPDVVIPRVIPELSSRRVLTMEFIEGLGFHEFIAQASEAEKQAAARTIYRFAMASYLRDGTFNADPHPGNYLFLGDGRVAFLDFGYAGDCPEERLDLWRELFRRYLIGDTDRIFEQMTALGFMADPDKFDRVEAKERATSMSLPYRERPFKFEHSHLKKIIRGTALTGKNRLYMALPPGDTRLFRFMWCLHMVMCDLGAEGNWGEMIEAILEEAEHAGRRTA
jgi:predicted unusual protein kinase regulating ubiquinone biosynthesis (AarF/ABC1/UbiB family)